MKTAHHLVLLAITSLMMPSGASADPNAAAAPSTSPPATTGGFLAIPDMSMGPPLVLPQPNPKTDEVNDLTPPPMDDYVPEQKQPTPSEMEDLKKQQELAEQNKNWLLHDYEGQVQNRAANPSQDKSTNLFYELSSNKALAKLAGIPYIDSATTDEKAAAARAEAEPSVTVTVTDLDNDSASQPKKGFLAHDNLFKPLISPWSSPDAASTSNVTHFLPVAMTSPLADDVPQTPDPPKTDEGLEATDLDMPGMVAAKENPAGNNTVPDLNLDVLPGETIEQARAHQDDRNSAELPVPINAAQLHKTEATLLSLPSINPVIGKPVLLALPKLPSLPDTSINPPVVSTPPRITPIRPPIANPYDILNR